MILPQCELLNYSWLL